MVAVVCNESVIYVFVYSYILQAVIGDIHIDRGGFSIRKCR